MFRTELKSLVDRCTRSDQRYLLAYLGTKDPAYRRELATADRDVAVVGGVRLRATRSGLVRVTA